MRHNPNPPAGHRPAGPGQPVALVVVELLNGKDARGWLAGVAAGRRIPWPVRHAAGTVAGHAVSWRSDGRRSCAAHPHGCGCPERLADTARAARAAAIDTGRRRRTPLPVTRGRYQVAPPVRTPWPPWADRLAGAAILAGGALALLVERLAR